MIVSMTVEYVISCFNVWGDSCLIPQSSVEIFLSHLLNEVPKKYVNDIPEDGRFLTIYCA